MHTYIHTDAANVLHVYVGLAQARPNKLFDKSADLRLSITAYQLIERTCLTPILAYQLIERTCLTPSLAYQLIERACLTPDPSVFEQGNCLMSVLRMSVVTLCAASHGIL